MICRKKKKGRCVCNWAIRSQTGSMPLTHRTSCNMSPRNIDTIANITPEKCSWELVIYSMRTLSPVSKNKLLIRNVWNKQHDLSESVTADRQKYLAEQQRGMKKSNLCTKCHQNYSTVNEGEQRDPSVLGIVDSPSSPSRTFEEGTRVSSEKTHSIWNKHTVHLPPNSGDKVVWQNRDWHWLGSAG